MAVRKGIITFGLVSIPVELHVAARSTSLDFDLLHTKDKGRVRYKLWCAEEDEEIRRNETVKAYKMDGGYVVMGPEDFEKVERATSRAIEVRHFVDLDAVDPIYLERSYWVGPQADTERSYQVLLKAMHNTKKAAVVTFVMSNRQHYALLRPDDEKFALHTLYYGDEVRAFEADWKQPKPGEREVKFAEQYIEALTKDFSPEEYRDEYRETLLGIIRAKAEGEEIKLPEAEKPPAKVVNLMEALRQSVEQMRRPLAKAERRDRVATEAKARARRRTAARGRKRGSPAA